MIRSRDELARLLAPMDLQGRETIRFAIEGHKSMLTRQLLELRMRRQGQVLGVRDSGDEALVGTAISADGCWLEVEAEALLAVDAAVRARLEGLGGVVAYLRLLAEAGEAVARQARAFGASMAEARPAQEALLAYLRAVSDHQALGGLAFCLPGDLARRITALAPEVEAEVLLRPERPSFALALRLRELALARARWRRRASLYERARRGFQRSSGYLGAEDTDFAQAEATEAIDRRIAALGSERQVAASLAALASARAEEQRRWRLAANAFARAAPDAHLTGLVLLARALATHDDRNRRAKMRLLRDLRDLARLAGRDLAIVTLEELVGARCLPP